METTIDLFERYDLLPDDIQEILMKHAEADETYENCANLEAELKPLGYTFEWGLDAIPYNLRKTNRK